MRNPTGPVAVIGSHGICFAAMGNLAADGVLESLSAVKPPQRLGELFLKLKQGIARGKMDELTFRLLDAVDGDGKIPQTTQRQEHLEMFLLLGDPALKLPRVEEAVQLKATGRIEPGGTININGQVSERFNEALVRLTLERPLTSEPLGLKALPADQGADRQQTMLANHERANRFVLIEQELSVKECRFETQLKLPEQLPWKNLVLRAYAATDSLEALGVISLPIAAHEE
jgi:hypothetical protein